MSRVTGVRMGIKLEMVEIMIVAADFGQPDDGGRGVSKNTTLQFHGGHDGDKRFGWFGLVVGY